MGKRGPQPTPTAQLEARGSWLAKLPERKRETAVAVIVDIPSAPEWLTPSAVLLWDSITREAQDGGTLSCMDLSMCGFLCERLSQYIALRDNAFSAQPVLVKDGLARTNPIIIQRNEAQRDCIRLLRELGMSPASRVGLVLAPKKAKPAGEISLFAKG